MWLESRLALSIGHTHSTQLTNIYGIVYVKEYGNTAAGRRADNMSAVLRHAHLPIPALKEAPR